MDQEIKREFDKLHREIKALKKDQDKAVWVGPSWIMQITGWSKRKLQSAREQGIVEWKKNEAGGLVYKLESIPEIFIKPLKQIS
jgi:hypothetical protein